MRAGRVVALGAAMMMGMGGVAVAQQADSSARPRAEQGRDGKSGRAEGARREGRRGGPGAGRALFRGIELSAEQRTRVQQINEKYRAEHVQLRERLHAARTAGRADSTQRPDSAQRAAFRAQVQQVMQRQHAELRGVLTAEQHAAFDRNVQELQQRMSQRRERGERRGRGGDRPRTGGQAGAQSGR